MAMKEMIYRNEVLKQGPYYAKLISIIQSSGTSKSRLIDEISKSHLYIIVILHENRESEYLSGEPEITKFLKEPLRAPKNILIVHTYILAFLD